jgi:CTP synthase
VHPKNIQPKLIFVTGGVISGLGKGITTASTALLLKSAGYKVSVLKADMYLNVDAGTMNPLEHGEVFVTEDGVETDQDIGNYERFLDRNLSEINYMTMGQVYYNVLMRERELGYDGKCVQGHIHIPEEITRNILAAAEKDDVDILLIEVGGTVGEYQNVMFYEAMRRLKQKYPNNTHIIHLVYLMTPGFLGEMKSKPAQTSIYELYKLGLQPDFVVCRSENPVDEKRRNTIAFNTGVRQDHIIAAPDVDTVYKIPLILEEQNLLEKLLNQIGLDFKGNGEMDKWKEMVTRTEQAKSRTRIAIVGKYFNSGDFSLEDSYVCVIEAVKHAAWSQDVRPEIVWFNAEDLEDLQKEKQVKDTLKTFDGIIVPQGWGSRGVEGKIKTVQFARENKIPYLGLCFGMQMAVIEFARNVLGLEKANSEEVDQNTPHPVIHVMPDQKEYLEKNNYGGTIRLGAWPCKLKPRTLLQKAYEKAEDRVENGLVQERHRHRYEVNDSYKKQLEEAGLVISGTSPDGMLTEAVELPADNHPFFVATQFHPEYKSRPLNPHPIFEAFIKASSKNKGS